MNRSTAFLLLIFFICLPGIAFSQPGGGGPPVPISGIEILIAAGAALGLRKFLADRNKK